MSVTHVAKLTINPNVKRILIRGAVSVAIQVTLLVSGIFTILGLVGYYSYVNYRDRQLLAKRLPMPDRGPSEPSENPVFKDCRKGIINFPKLSDVNVVDNAGWTLLHYAVTGENKDFVIKLLNKGADPKIKNHGGQTALDLVAIYPNEEIERILSEDPIFCSFRGLGPLTPFPKREFKQKFDQLSDINIVDSNGDTLLHHAVKHKLVKVIRVLIDKGANKDVKNNNGETPLNMAQMEQIRREFVDDPIFRFYKDFDPRSSTLFPEQEFLQKLNQLSDINIVDSNGWTLLHHAIKNKQINVVEDLIYRGADPLIENNNKQLAFHLIEDINLTVAINQSLISAAYSGRNCEINRDLSRENQIPQ